MNPRVVIVHSHAPMIVTDGSGVATPAHCFGPFESAEEAAAFEALAPDECYKFVIDIVGPDPDDVDRSAGNDEPDAERVN